MDGCDTGVESARRTDSGHAGASLHADNLPELRPGRTGSRTHDFTSLELRPPCRGTPMKVLFLSHTPPSGVFRVGSHHLAREFAAKGHDVAHVSTPLSVVTEIADRVASRDNTRSRFARTPTMDSDGVLQFVPRIATPASRTPTVLNTLQMAGVGRAIRRSLPSFAEPDVVLVDQPLMEATLRQLRPDLIVYRPTDAHPDHLARTAEVRLLGRVKGVAATSHQTLASVLHGSAWARASTVIENGVEFARFSDADEATRKGVVYLGALDDRFDWQTIRVLAEAFPQERFTLAGPQTGDPGALPSNVALMGGVPYSEAPALLAQHSVGLLPFSDHPGNHSRSPMKYFEYLAAGLSVVGRKTSGIADRETPNVWLYESDRAAVTVLAEALHSPGELRDAGRAAAANQSWVAKASDLLEFIDILRHGAGR